MRNGGPTNETLPSGLVPWYDVPDNYGQERTTMATDIMTSEQAAEYLQIGIVTLKKKAREGSIPAAKIGRAWRFRRKDLEEWVGAGGDISEEQVDWAFTELVKERIAEAKRTGEKPIPLEEVLREYGL
jgi:excisionase family DNA binding protein